MEVKVITKSGAETGRTADLPETVFSIEPSDHAIYLAVKQHLAARRQGTHKAKERAEIVGSTKKLKKQKGTGTARAGSIKSPVFRGGGRIFGPRPRDYSFKVNKKVKSLAKKSALSYKASDANITIIEDFVMESPKTKDFIEILKEVNAQGIKTLMIIPESDKNIYLSSRNLPKAKVLPVDQINTFDILHADKILITENALSKITAMFN